MKRTLAMLLVFALVFSMIPLSALAADTHSVELKVDTSEFAELNPGDTIKVPVVAVSNDGVTSFGLEATFDENYFEKVSGTYTSGAVTITTADNMAYYENADLENITTTGTLFYVNLKVKDNAPSGTTEIGIKIVNDNATQYFYYLDEEYNMVPITDTTFTPGTVTIAGSSGDEGDEPETNTGYEVYYLIEGTDTEPDSFVEINPGATFDVGVYVKSTDDSTKKMQAFDIYPTWDSMLSYVSVVKADAGDIVADEMDATNPHFYSVAKDLNKAVPAEGVKIATLTLKLSENAVYNTGYAVSLSNKTNMAVELNAESVPVTVDTTVKGAETRKKVKVTFNTDGGSAVAEQEIGYNTTATKPATNPSKDGYTFDNWYKEAAFTNVFDFSTALKVDTIIYAKWDADDVTVTLNSNDGKFADDATEKTVTETFGEKYTALFGVAEPTREGYSFKGWYDATTGGNKIETTTLVNNAEAHTLYAQWTAHTYTVEFDLNGVEGTAPENIPATYGVEFALPTMNIEGYTFGGWKLGETTYTGGQTVKNLTAEDKATVTLVAQWTQNDYEIKTEATNGTVNAVNADNTSGASANKGDTINVTITESTAGYALDVNSVTYTPEGGEAVTITVTKQENGSYTGTFTMPAADVTVSATFNAIDYTVEVDSGITNGTVTIQSGENSVNKIENAHVGDIVTLNVAPGTHYVVYSVSYTKEGETAENTITANEGVYSFVMPAANVTVNATFAGETYTVTLNANGGNFVEGDQSVNTKEISATYSGTYSELSTVTPPTRLGYTFAGWFTDAENGTEIKATDTVLSGAPLYAHWTANEYTITFVTNNGSFGENSGVVDNKMTYTYGDANAKLPAITKALHTFVNWTVSYDADATEKGWGNAGDPINGESAIGNYYGNVTLTANWKADFTYEVEDYKYAPADYVMLRIATASNTNSYIFGSGESAIDMYYTEDTNYKVGDSFAFVTLIPKTGNVELKDGKYVLTSTGLDQISQTGAAADVIARDGKVNNDDVVNIADANAVYQMVIGGGSYYSLAQLEILNRLEADMNTAPTTGETNNEYRGSILDVDAIVDIINDNANSTTNP